MSSPIKSACPVSPHCVMSSNLCTHVCELLTHKTGHCLAWGHQRPFGRLGNKMAWGGRGNRVSDKRVELGSKVASGEGKVELGSKSDVKR